MISPLLDNSIISKNKNVAVVFASSISFIYIFSYVYSGYKTPSGIWICLITGSIFLVLRRDIQKKCIHWFLNVFALLCFFSLVEFAIDILTGRRIVVAQVMREVTDGYQIFNETLFNVRRVENDMPRFQSLTEEPGLLGTLCGMLLFLTHGDRRYQKHFYVFLTSLFLSFSLGGYVIAIFYMFFLRIKNIKIMLGTVVVFVCMIIYFGAFFQKLIYERLQSDDVDNRTNETFDRQFYQSLGSGELLLGKGNINYQAAMEGHNAGGKVWIYHYGIIGFFAVFFSYNYIFVLVRRKGRLSYDQIIFLLAFWLSFYQRSDITAPYFLMAFLGVALFDKKVENTRMALLTNNADKYYPQKSKQIDKGKIRLLYKKYARI